MTDDVRGPEIAALILSLLHRARMSKADLIARVIDDMRDSGVLQSEVEDELRDLQGSSLVARSNGEGDWRLTTRGQKFVDEALGKAGETADLIEAN